jgi:hypothetical protein
MGRLEGAAREGYDQLIGLELSDVAVDVCLTKAPWRGEVSGPNPTARGKLGIKRSTLVDAVGLPVGGGQRPSEPARLPVAGTNPGHTQNLSPLHENTRVHLDAGHDSGVTRIVLAERGLQGAIAHKGGLHLSRPPNVGRSNAPTAGTTTSTNWLDAPNAARSSPTSTSRWPTPSSRSADSWAEPGPSTAGTPDPGAGRDLLAYPLSHERQWLAARCHCIRVVERDGPLPLLLLNAALDHHT